MAAVGTAARRSTRKRHLVAAPDKLRGTATAPEVAAALGRAAARVIVGLGGSATTDGGLAALRALHPLGRLKGVDLVVACDSRVGFLEAATSFAAQKGATAAQVELLRRRLERLAQVYLDEHGVGGLTLEGAGAAGGLGGGAGEG